VEDARPRRRGSQQTSFRLASVPKMFGDIFFAGGDVRGSFTPVGVGPQLDARSSLPLGGARRLKIAENGSPIPDDRVYFMYNHFHNSLAAQVLPLAAPPGASGLAGVDSNIDRYVVGIERMYLDDLASIEVRMPWCSSFDFQAGTFDMDGGNVGNLQVVMKYLLLADDISSLGAGLAVDIPTGSDVSLSFAGGDPILQLGAITIENDAVHLLPYLGLVLADDTLFIQFFGQLDFAVNGNDVRSLLLAGDSQFNDQNLLFLDVSAGYWLYRDPDACAITGLAALAELHYTTSIQDADQVVIPQINSRPAVIGNEFNRFDVLNLTAGFDTEIANTTSLRVGAAVPVEGDFDDRFFDAELQVQVNRRY
jgi:hypothetical protein